jgi:hypothetical protein
MNEQHMESILPYDMVSLPSQGVFYQNGKKSVKVTYLNASDENLLATPSMIGSGELVDSLLSRKIIQHLGQTTPLVYSTQRQIQSFKQK